SCGCGNRACAFQLPIAQAGAATAFHTHFALFDGDGIQDKTGAVQGEAGGDAIHLPPICFELLGFGFSENFRVMERAADGAIDTRDTVLELYGPVSRGLGTERAEDGESVVQIMRDDVQVEIFAEST